MLKVIFIILQLTIPLISFSQERAVAALLADSSLLQGSLSVCITDEKSGITVFELNSGKSLIPASVMKLITSAAAVELLGPGYTFKTVIGYTGSLNKRTGRLKGNIVIIGGGDPALGSKYFSDHYQDFLNNWVIKIKNLGITKIDGRVITDDSRYDFQPVPSKWLWEDIGNYYGAGVYGLSVFDNTYEIHLKSSEENTIPVIMKIIPSGSEPLLTNRLSASGTKNNGFIFASPYGTSGWMSGTVPVNNNDFTLKGAITDPPALLAKLLTNRLEETNIIVRNEPSTVQSGTKILQEEVILIDEIQSPPLKDIIRVLNHESVNLFAEHLLKELGKKFANSGSTIAGVTVLMGFLQSARVNTDGLFLEDGSGLSPSDAINTRELNQMLLYMRNNGKYFPEYLESLPEAGKEGTLKNVFADPVFNSRIWAKSGSMTRVRNYAGYLTASSGNKYIFSIVVNNFTGQSADIISGIEEILKEVILNR